ncbi:MAG: ribosome silencing factor [Clostridia bacterium]|nr:ribosome silencing factor [Clostridia bacterium]MCL6520794.1 ribosome silencing factor [Bacillota bacterium]
MQALERARAAVRILEEHRAFDTVILDLTGLEAVADYFVLASGRNPIQLRAQADALREELPAERPVRPEGYQAGRWICLDYGDVVVHLFTEEAREFYDLDRLWRDARRVEAAAP